MKPNPSVFLSLIVLSATLQACGPAEDPKAPQVNAAPEAQSPGLKPSNNLSKLQCKDLSGKYSLQKSSADTLSISIKQTGCSAIQLEADRIRGAKHFSWKSDQSPVNPELCRIPSKDKTVCHRHQIDADSYRHEVWNVNSSGKRVSLKTREIYRLESDGALNRTTEFYVAGSKQPKAISEKLLPR